MSARITNVRTGTGDKGYSNLSSGLKMRKSNVICSLQNNLQLLNNSLRCFIHNSEKFNQLISHDQDFLTSLSNSLINSISASVYFNFEDHEIPNNKLQYLERRIENLSYSVGQTQEFIIVEKDLLVLEQVLIYTRQVEHLFWSVVDQNNYYSLSKGDKKEVIIQNLSSFLNALSDYFFLLIRSLSSEISYWDKSVLV